MRVTAWGCSVPLGGRAGAADGAGPEQRADGGTAGSGRETQSSPGTSSGLGGMVGGQGPRGQRARSRPHLACPRQGNTVELPEEENTPEKRVDRIFAMMDKVRPLV